MHMDVQGYSTDRYNRVGASELLERLGAEPLLVQGPMGTVLMSEPGGEDIPAAVWNVAEPKTVERVHALYRAAGAEVMLTNTFQASAPALARDRVPRDVAEVNRAGVDCARRAGATMLLGSMGPCGVSWMLEDSREYREARAAYRDQAHALLDAGVDGLLLETFTSVRDFDPAIAGVLDVADGMPVIASFAVNEKGDLLGDGLNIEAAVLMAEQRGVAAAGVNCCSLQAATEAVPRMAAATKLPIMVRPNAGDPHRDEDGSLVWDEDPEAIATCAIRWVRDGAAAIGSCCGTTARTTCALSEALLSIAPQAAGSHH